MDTPKLRILESSERANPVSAVHCWQSPAGAAVEITVIAHLDVYAGIHQHAVESLPNETGGFLLGHVAFDSLRRSWHIEVDETLPVEPLSQDPVHFSFTWRDVDRVRTHRESERKALIGWYHTHPDIGIFLSETDLEKTHRVLFAEPFQLALVYDPVRGRAGYFFWEGPQTIDASQAAWREFQIAIGDAPQSAEPSESVVRSVPSTAAVASNGPMDSRDRGDDGRTT
jgi:proteasome lid subunit RPN8/RPN11